MQELIIRFAEEVDSVECGSIDEHLPSHLMERKIENREIIVAEMEDALVGYLRFEYLWSTVPYIALIIITPELRGQGIGTHMLEFLEDFLRDLGHNTLMSSSQADEPEPEAWHRERGFHECGFISGINAGGVGEVFFRKQLD